MKAEDRARRLLRELERHGYRPTPQREAVCWALANHGGHPTAAEIFEAVKSHGIGQATVYNTITALEKLGVIQAMPLNTDEHTRYDLDTTPHVNFVCSSCGAIIDCHAPQLDLLLAQIASSAGATFESANVVVYGRCESCPHRQVQSA
jgi:Fe2+ or Zn2+ uptake regulation protein